VLDDEGALLSESTAVGVHAPMIAYTPGTPGARSGHSE
jgi:hypothetical protein